MHYECLAIFWRECEQLRHTRRADWPQRSGLFMDERFETFLWKFLSLLPVKTTCVLFTASFQVCVLLNGTKNNRLIYIYLILWFTLLKNTMLEKQPSFVDGLFQPLISIWWHIEQQINIHILIVTDVVKFRAPKAECTKLEEVFWLKLHHEAQRKTFLVKKSKSRNL